jgi:hypothetical protein
VIPFCGKVEEWTIWSERLLAKAKRCSFKDLLLGKFSISEVDKEINETSDCGKKKSMVIKSNEISYTELILSIDVKDSSVKVAVNIIRKFKIKGDSDVNCAIA